MWNNYNIMIGGDLNANIDVTKDKNILRNLFKRLNIVII